jgi:SWI/SNF-related matrix-associated actin-dependent regulator of chromatin subfamily E protein 1
MDSMNNSSFTIEPSTDDDEADDIYFSSRHIAAARFQRNQRLLCEIFNEVCIPDLRSNVNVDRISTLRRQVEALKTHRETFEKDLNELEEKHSDKKRKFLEANEKFHNEYAEASSTNLSREKINEILQKYEAMEKLQKEKQLLLQQQQQQAAATPPPPPPPPPV